MRLEHESPKHIKQAIIGIVQKYLDLNDYSIFFFGSRVSENSYDQSDIDVGIEGKPIPGETMFSIKEDLNNLPILYTIDIVDFAKVSSYFYDNAKQKIEYIQ